MPPQRALSVTPHITQLINLIMIKFPAKLLIVALTFATSVASFAATVTWTGGNYTWTQPDSDSFNAQYNSGDTVIFGNTGITNATVGETAIVISGGGTPLTPAAVTFTHTQARVGTPGGGGGFNYLFTSNGTTNVITSPGSLTLGQGNTIFRALTTSGTYTHSFSGALNYSDGTMLGLSSDNAARIMTLQVGSLATPTKGNSILFNAITTASGNGSGAVWSATGNRLIVTGAKPAVENGMVSAGLQFYTGGNILGEFMTFSGDNLIPATANYNAGFDSGSATEIANITVATTLAANETAHAVRTSQDLNLGGFTLAVTGGGFITSSRQTFNGTLDFGTGPAFIGAYNTAAQAGISAKISGTGGVTILGTSQALSLSGANDFTGGLYVNGGVVRLNTVGAANQNDTTVNALGTLEAGITNAAIGGLSGIGLVRTANNASRTLVISPSTDTHTFNGSLTDQGTGLLSITKEDSGTQVFGSNINATYTGATAVNGGKLVINGAINSSNTTVNSGGTLGGEGSVKSLTLNAGGAIAPGNSIGQLNTANGNLTWNGEADSTFAQMKFELGNTADQGVAAVADQIALGSGIFAKGTGSVYQFDFLNTGAAGNTYTLLTFGGFSGFTDGSDFSYTGLTSDLTGTFNLSSTELTFQTVPEPTTVAMLIGGVGLLTLLRRRRMA